MFQGYHPKNYASFWKSVPLLIRTLGTFDKYILCSCVFFDNVKDIDVNSLSHTLLVSLGDGTTFEKMHETCRVNLSLSLSLSLSGFLYELKLNRRVQSHFF
jgi:hypothetical protein